MRAKLLVAAIVAGSTAASLMGADDIRINRATESELVATGLFSEYQAASLLDYIRWNGPVYSLEELSLLDGFSEDIVRFLEPYINLEASPMWAMPDTVLRNELSLRIGASSLTDFKSTFKPVLKYRMDYGGWSASLSLTRGGLSAQDISVAYTAPLKVDALDRDRAGPRLVKAVLGDINCRFAQGLALWSGTTISSMPSPRYLCRSASGISMYTGSSGNSLRGAGAVFGWGPVRLSAVAAFPDAWTAWRSNLLAVSLDLSLPRVDVGVLYYMKTLFPASGVSGEKSAGISVSAKTCIGGADVFAELAYEFSGHLGIVAGTSFPAGDALYLGLLLRRYPASLKTCCPGAFGTFSTCSNEHGVSLLGEFLRKGQVSLDCAWNPVNRWPLSGGTVAGGASHPHSIQFKLKAEYMFGKKDGAFSLRPVFSYRLRSGGEFHRTDFRTEMCLSPLSWHGFILNSKIYLSAVSTVLGSLFPPEHIGRALVLEPGYKGKAFSLYCSFCAFHIDHWQERIYIYRRDVAGTFNVPAVYGRGGTLCLFASASLLRWMRLSLHFSGTVTTQKPPAFSARVLVSASF